MCQRYFIRLVDPPARGPAGSATLLSRLGFMLPVHMRIAPTVTVSGTAMVYNGVSGSAIAVFNNWYTTPNSVEFDATAAAAAFAGGQAISLYKNGGGSCFFDIDAEVP